MVIVHRVYLIRGFQYQTKTQFRLDPGFSPRKRISRRDPNLPKFEKITLKRLNTSLKFKWNSIFRREDFQIPTIHVTRNQTPTETLLKNHFIKQDKTLLKDSVSQQEF